MARTLVVNDDASATVEITIDPDVGYATASCTACGWTTDPDRFDGLADVRQESEIHIDQEH